ncbi:MAG TPA: tripartite tricarboxylate transporter substrate binding protein [Pseudolabrys sp.]|nr:tripartite tricarboxylate transporter substrate binding protein [Pseudolabrys sp.]
MLKRMHQWLSVGAAAVALLAIDQAPARAEWPERTITIVAHFAPGGSNDLLARLIASELGPALKQNVIVENRPGANGNIGLTYAAHAAPDGYTLVVASGVVEINPSIRKSGYEMKDFAPVAFLGASPNVILTRPASGITDVKDLIAKAKAEPGKITYASPGIGSVSQLAVELLELRTQTKLIHVPFQGAAPAAQGAMAGTTDIGSVNVAGLIGFIQSGKLKPLVQTGETRWPDLPDVPTMQEAGIPNAVVETTQMLLAPAGTPQPVIDRLAREVKTIMAKPDVRAKMLKASFAVQYEGPEELNARIAREVPMWKDLVERAGIRLD